LPRLRQPSYDKPEFQKKPGKAGGRLAGVLGPGADAEGVIPQHQRIRVHESGEALRASAVQDYCCA
jgi:hypothetical protein